MALTDNPPDGLRRGTILPAPACDLLDRLTSELDIRFTLTDARGVVVASTARRRAGTIERHAAKLLERADAADQAGANASEGATAVYCLLRLSGVVSGVLVAHGAPDRLRDVCRIAGVSIGLALDFSAAASSLGRESSNPGLLLYRLLRGSREEAHQTRIVAAICGWNLFVQRVAIVVMAAAPPGRKARQMPLADPIELLTRLLGPAASTTPFGQVDDSQWVILVQHEPQEPWGRIRQLAEDIQAAFLAGGWEARVGIGEPHLPVYPVVAVRNSYREAIYAARLGPRLQGEPGPFELRGLGAAAFFAPSGPSRRNLALLALEPLREHPLVLETLSTYLASNMSVADTAARLSLHRHTVRNHLARAFTLTGLDPRTLEGAVQLKLALLVITSDPDGADSWRSP
ncbi:MAG: helix-turn-helix domain-containing protein [Gemmatimonadetes bacterium]|nr:helix-turn-helix domain-containing protein [Gemmatimonadota bacterium]